MDGVARARRVMSTVLAAELAVLVVGLTRPRERVMRVIVGFGALTTLLATSLTGVLLPWDQLALRAVRVGTNMHGFTPLFGDQVRFVLIGHSEISTRTVVVWLIVHIALGGIAGGLAIATWRSVRRRQSDGSFSLASSYEPVGGSGSGP